MPGKPQIIYQDGKPAFVVLPWAEYEMPTDEAEEADLSDEELYDLALAADEEFFPVEVVDRILGGENPLKVYREHRGLTQKDLAARVGLNPVYVSQIETGKRAGSARTLKRVAQALDIDLDDLV